MANPSESSASRPFAVSRQLEYPLAVHRRIGGQVEAVHHVPRFPQRGDDVRQPHGRLAAGSRQVRDSHLADAVTQGVGLGQDLGVDEEHPTFHRDVLEDLPPVELEGPHHGFIDQERGELAVQRELLKLPHMQVETVAQGGNRDLYTPKMQEELERLVEEIRSSR